MDWRQPNVHHVKDLVAKSPSHGQSMRPLLGARSKDKHAAVISFREELQTGRICEGMDVVLLGEALGERHAQRIKVAERILANFRAACLYLCVSPNEPPISHAWKWLLVDGLHIEGKEQSLGFPRLWALASPGLASNAHCAVFCVHVSKSAITIAR